MAAHKPSEYKLHDFLPPLAAALASASGSIGYHSFGSGGAVIVALLWAAIALAGMRGLRRHERSPSAAASDGVTKKGAALSEDRLDPLTGLANLNGLHAWFEENAAHLERDHKAIIVMAADLANFTDLRKARGDELANAVIKEAARRVGAFIGDNGIAARIDGEEFAAIAAVVPSRSIEIAAERAGKLAELLQRPVELPTGVIWIGGSVGVATGSPSKGTAVLERARKALRKAKQIGRGHYSVDNATDD